MMKKTLLALAVSSALSGCGSMIQAVNAYGAIAVSDARAANDTVIAGWTLAACATPVSAALRNPQIIPALKVLCMSGADIQPASLLEGAEQRNRELQITADRAAAELAAMRTTMMLAK